MRTQRFRGCQVPSPLEWGQEGSAGSPVWVLVRRQLGKWHDWLREVGRVAGKGGRRGQAEARAKPRTQASL